ALLAEKRTDLAHLHGVRARVIGLVTRHSQLLNVEQGLGSRCDIENSECGIRTTGRATSTLAFIRDACARDAAAAREGRLVIVETTTLDVATGEPAVSHVGAALAGGGHVITTNKGPAAFAYRRLMRQAARAERRL